ncbi:MAG: c-type cytochrome [Bacteroidia bacterium]
MSRTSLKLLLGLAFVCFFGSGSVSAADGKAIYKQNCAVCHALTDQVLTGPGLAGIAGKVPPGDWLFRWVKNNKALIKSGDAHAVKVFKENGGKDMTVFEGTLSDEDITAVVEFIKNPPPPTTGPTTTTTTGGPVAAAPTSGGIDPLYIILSLIVILALLIGVLRAVRMSLQNVVNRKEGKEEVPSVPFMVEAKDWCARHRRFLGVMGIVIVFLGMKGCWDGLWDIGVYYNEETKTGYRPEQPIKFSHKIHAGDNAIACQYCHNSVEKSRHAGIPTVNVCMNCHKGIQEGPTTGKTEIAKIYAAAGFDPKTGNYDHTKENPIKWIKVHNLPDHVYFNHSQHVVVGKQECTTCHGEVREMTVAEQKSPLTMGWCIDCHRKTEVAMDGNPYYDKLHAYMKEKYKDQHLKNFTVSQVGGIECGKCHY